MYQAIVLLPLLGAIVAGIISIVGARLRHPGGPALHGAEDAAHDAHAGRHGSGAPSAHGDAAAIHATHHEPIEHGPAEPPAQGSRAAELITCTLLVIAAILSWIAFVRVGYMGQDARVHELDAAVWQRTACIRGSSRANFRSIGRCASTH